MEISVTIQHEPIVCPQPPVAANSGALATFTGLIRNTEADAPILAICYEAYKPMAETMIRRILTELAVLHPFDACLVIHRIGHVPAGDAAIHVAVASKHRAEAFQVLTKFMDRLKCDVPIWKTDIIHAPQ